MQLYASGARRVKSKDNDDFRHVLAKDSNIPQRHLINSWSSLDQDDKQYMSSLQICVCRFQLSLYYYEHSIDTT